MALGDLTRISFDDFSGNTTGIYSANQSITNQINPGESIIIQFGVNMNTSILSLSGQWLIFNFAWNSSIRYQINIGLFPQGPAIYVESQNYGGGGTPLSANVSVKNNNYYWIQIRVDRKTGYGGAAYVYYWDGADFNDKPGHLIQSRTDWFDSGFLYIGASYEGNHTHLNGTLDLTPLMWAKISTTAFTTGYQIPWNSGRKLALYNFPSGSNITNKSFVGLGLTDVIKLDYTQYLKDALSSNSSPNDPDTTYTPAVKFTPSDPDKFKTRLADVVSSWQGAFNGTLNQTRDFIASITGNLGPFSSVAESILNEIIKALQLVVNIGNDALKALVQPLGGFIDSIIKYLDPVMSNALSGILNWISTEVDFIPFMPELSNMFIAILSGASDWQTELSAIIDAIGTTVVGSIRDVISMVLGLSNFVITTAFEILDVSVTTTDVTPMWNQFVSLLAEDEDDYASLGTPGAKLGIHTMTPGTFIIPTKVSFLSIEYDFLDVILTVWCMKKLPWFTIDIIGEGVSIPLGGMFYFVKDEIVPFSYILAPFNTQPTKFGNLLSGFTFKDIVYDLFILDMAILLGHWLGPRAKQALFMALNQISSRLKPNIKDVIKRMQPDGGAMKYSSAVDSLYDNVLALSNQLASTTDDLTATTGKIDAIQSSLTDIGKILRLKTAF